MKSDEPTPSANQGVSRDTTNQLSGDWYSHLIDFDGPSFVEHYGLGVSYPERVFTGRAVEFGSALFKGRLGSLEVVLAAVSFHT